MSDFETLLQRRVQLYSRTNDRAFDADAIAESATTSRRPRWSFSVAVGRQPAIARPMLATSWLLIIGLIVIALAGVVVVGSRRAPVTVTPSPSGSLRVVVPPPSTTAPSPARPATDAPSILPTATLLPARGMIIYGDAVNLGSLDYDIIAVRPDGSARRVIATGSCPTVSRDGSVIAFLTGLAHEGTGRLSVSNQDGTGARTVGKAEIELAANLSPDGSLALDLSGYTSATVGGTDPNWTDTHAVRVTDMADGSQRVLASHAPGTETHDASPVWSPDGKWVAFITSVGPTPAQQTETISVANLATNAIYSLASVDGALDPAWSADGSHIAYYQDLRFHFIGADPFGPRDTSETDMDLPSGGVWSPDGSAVAFVTPDGLAVAEINGTHVASITYGPTHVRSVAWSPDSSHLLFTEPGPYRYSSLVEIVDRRLSEAPTFVANVARTDLCINWAPDAP